MANVSLDELAGSLEAFERARMLATAGKRKLDRMHGALDVVKVVQELGSSSSSSGGRGASEHSASLLKTEAELTSSFDELARLLEQSDGGDAFKRARAAWYEAGGLAEFVRAHAELAAYLPAIEREVAEVREEWEQVQPARKELARQKQRVAHLQGQMYARLELGFTLPANLGDVLTEQQATWQREESMTSQQLAQHVETLAARRAHMEQSHREQGWRKGAERFGEVMGLSSEALLTVRLAILEADATQLRLRAKATMRAMHELMSQHEQVHAELHELTGQLELLTGIRERPCSEAQLLADEYEAAVEAEVLRGTLSTLRPRVAEAAHLRLAWHAKAGACKAGEALHAPNLPALHTALVDAKRLADAAEPIRRQELVLRAKLAKLHGRLQALGQLRTLAAAGTDSATLASEAERLASAARLQQLRLSMRATDLRLLHMRHERAEANLHAAGGAIVCLKKLRFSLHNAPAVAHEGGRASAVAALALAAAAAHDPLGAGGGGSGGGGGGGGGSSGGGGGGGGSSGSRGPATQKVARRGRGRRGGGFACGRRGWRSWARGSR